MSGGNAETDLYVRYGQVPTLDYWDYRPLTWGNDETVVINNPTAGNWYLNLVSETRVSGLTIGARLQGDYNQPPTYVTE